MSVGLATGIVIIAWMFVITFMIGINKVTRAIKAQTKVLKESTEQDIADLFEDEEPH